jgi:hypothetical protein
MRSRSRSLVGAGLLAIVISLSACGDQTTRAVGSSGSAVTDSGVATSSATETNLSDSPTKPPDTGYLPESAVEPFDTGFFPHDGEAPISASVFASTSRWAGHVNGVRTIVYAGENGYRGLNGEPDPHQRGEVWVLQFDRVMHVIGGRFLDFDEMGLLHMDKVDGTVITMSDKRGCTVTIDLSTIDIRSAKGR